MMITVYAVKDMGQRMWLRILDFLRLVSGMKPSIAPESPVSEEERASQSDVAESDSHPTVRQRLSSNQRGRYGRH
jgi:hypothetical protein